MLRLFSNDAPFFDDFERQARCIVVAGRLLHDLIVNFEDVQAKVRAIKDVEHEGDQITHAIVTRLNTTFVTPLDREDIHRLASRLDDVLDFIDEAAASLLVYRVTAPTSECRAMADVVVDTVAVTAQAVRCLRRLDPSFSRHKVEVHRHENRADELLHRSIAALFDEQVDPVEVLKWKDIYTALESVTDRCDDVANVIESIMLKMA
jgi:predicted phosphate transport protein (TIGR00153 family)